MKTKFYLTIDNSNGLIYDCVVKAKVIDKNLIKLRYFDQKIGKMVVGIRKFNKIDRKKVSNYEIISIGA